MNKKELEIHEAVDMTLTNILDKIDLAIYHIDKSNEDYNNHIYNLQEMKKNIKKILNKDFDKLARNKK
ncbi:MAG: hypothetical protein HC854_17695 [Flavobacterium sp.]|nr:hypothetical protein [Flavobacterium sp.]